MISSVVGAVGASIVLVHARESRRARAHTGRIHKKGIAKRRALPDHPVPRQRRHTVATSGADSVKVLLVRQHQNDIGPRGHLFLLHPRFLKRPEQKGDAKKQQTQSGRVHRHRAAIVQIITPVLLAYLIRQHPSSHFQISLLSR